MCCFRSWARLWSGPVSTDARSSLRAGQVSSDEFGSSALVLPEGIGRVRSSTIRRRAPRTLFFRSSFLFGCGFVGGFLVQSERPQPLHLRSSGRRSFVRFVQDLISAQLGRTEQFLGFQARLFAGRRLPRHRTSTLSLSRGVESHSRLNIRTRIARLTADLRDFDVPPCRPFPRQ